MEIFLHIPKTAGSTLNHVLRYQYRTRDAIFPINHWDPRQAARRFHSLSPERQCAVQLIQGHVHFGLHQHLNGPASYFTVLRDPVERVISHYHYVRSTPWHKEHAAVTSRKMTLKDYVAGGHYPELDNGQTRMLAGIPGLFDQTQFGGCGEELLALAEVNLDKHFRVVGIQERFDDTLLLLRTAYGWSEPYYVAQNVTRARPRQSEVPQDTRDVIHSFNEIDARLYAYVARRFEDEIARQGQGFIAARRRFQAANARYGQVNCWTEEKGMIAGRFLKKLLRVG